MADSWQENLLPLLKDEFEEASVEERVIAASLRIYNAAFQALKRTEPKEQLKKLLELSEMGVSDEGEVTARQSSEIATKFTDEQVHMLAQAAQNQIKLLLEEHLPMWLWRGSLIFIRLSR